MVVQINGIKYVFSNQIGTEKVVFESFNQLAKDTFGISFDYVGGEYEPHVLLKDGKVCANVSVNQMHFSYRGEKKYFIQLGTVMTDKAYRGKGLSRWLLEYIINEWKDRCEQIYLFANDSVLEFYPKFGFIPVKQYQFVSTEVKPVTSPARKLDMDRMENVRLVQEKYSQGNPFAAFYMTDNQVLLDFYCGKVMKDDVYYSPAFDVVIVAEKSEGKLACHDVFGKTTADLNEILGTLVPDERCHVVLGFTPREQTGLECRECLGEDTTLFILNAEKMPFAEERLMFPVLSHA